jgi:hypothetical protein
MIGCRGTPRPGWGGRCAIQITPQEFRVRQACATRERQAALVARGASRTMHSRHLTGHAVDLVALGRARSTTLMASPTLAPSRPAWLRRRQGYYPGPGAVRRAASSSAMAGSRSSRTASRSVVCPATSARPSVAVPASGSLPARSRLPTGTISNAWSGRMQAAAWTSRPTRRPGLPSSPLCSPRFGVPSSGSPRPSRLRIGYPRLRYQAAVNSSDSTVPFLRGRRGNASGVRSVAVTAERSRSKYRDLSPQGGFP